jgi:hypothetical protein
LNKFGGFPTSGWLSDLSTLVGHNMCENLRDEIHQKIKYEGQGVPFELPALE